MVRGVGVAEICCLSHQVPEFELKASMSLSFAEDVSRLFAEVCVDLIEP